MSRLWFAIQKSWGSLAIAPESPPPVAPALKQERVEAIIYHITRHP